MERQCYQAFDQRWFDRHQPALVWLLNSPLTRRWFRWVLCITKQDIGYEGYLSKIGPNHYQKFIGYDGDRKIYQADFRVHHKYGKRLYYAFRPIWWAMHAWDLVADPLVPSLSFGFSTLTVYPDPTGGTTTDGRAYRTGVDETFGTIRAGAGNGSDDTETFASHASLNSSSTTNQYQSFVRSIYTFDTSPLTSSAIISAAVLSLFGKAQTNGLGTTTIEIVSSTPASNNTIVNGDFSQTGATSFSSMAYASWSTIAYNDLTLNASGISNISKTGISKFGARLGWDLNNSFTGTWSSAALTSFQAYYADQTGTANDPKLVVTYTAPTAYTKTLTETITLTDTIAKGPTRSLTESFTLTDTFSSLKVRPKTLTETITLTDTILKGPTRILTETLTLTDTVLKSISKTLSETISLSDSITKLRTAFVTLSETISLSDSLQRTATKVLKETLTLTDTVKKTIGRIFRETLNLADAILTVPLFKQSVSKMKSDQQSNPITLNAQNLEPMRSDQQSYPKTLDDSELG